MQRKKGSMRLLIIGVAEARSSGVQCQLPQILDLLPSTHYNQAFSLQSGNVFFGAGGH